MKIRKSGRAVSVPAGLGFALMVNMVITTIATIILAIMINQNKIEWEDCGYWIMFTLLISSFLGAKTAILTIKSQMYLIAFMSGLLYWIILLCITALFFGANYSSVFETSALIAAGSITAALIRTPKNKISSRKSRSVYR